MRIGGRPGREIADVSAGHFGRGVRASGDRCVKRAVSALCSAPLARLPALPDPDEAGMVRRTGQGALYPANARAPSSGGARSLR